MENRVFEKLTVLGEGAKYDVSCSSSGADRTNIGRLGNAACAGICHSWTADGRCVSLLKVLLSNDCVYDCRYCVNRRSADVARCTFEPGELADLTMEFYRRNYIEGLFLSSAVLRSPDNTVERMYECLWLLREAHGFAGYIHAKVIPGVSPEILTQLGLVSDRLSVNVELPSEVSLDRLAPQKKPKAIFAPMRQITQTQAEQKTLKAAGSMSRLRPTGLNISVGDGCLDDIMEAAGKPGAPEDFTGFAGAGAMRADGSGAGRQAGRSGIAGGSADSTQLVSDNRRKHYKERFAPAGQTTQMIIGASPESDREIIGLSEALYRRYAMKRVYFAAYIPVAAGPELPSLLAPPPLKREHRLYQADWLLRFYGFSANEILTADEPNLDYELDPKVVWALRHLDLFPIEVNRASEEELLRIPGIGNTSAIRILRQRRIAAVKYDDLKKMGVVLKRARFFITCDGRYYGDNVLEPVYLRERILSGEETDMRRAGFGHGEGGRPCGRMSCMRGSCAGCPYNPERRGGGRHATRESYAANGRNAGQHGQNVERYAAGGRSGNRVPPSTRVPDLRLDSRKIRTALGGGEKPQISMFESEATDRPSLPDARPSGCPNDRPYAMEVGNTRI